MDKRFNKNIIVFIICMLFILSGLCSADFAESVFEPARKLVSGFIHLDSSLVKNKTQSIEKVTTEKLVYHNHLMDVNSLRENVFQTRIIKKDNEVILKSDSGQLYVPRERYTDQELDETVDRIEGLYKKAESCGAHFLYVSAPEKGDYFSAPINTANHSKFNHDGISDRLEERGIPYLDFEKEFFDKSPEEIFFYTDHHWKPEIGFEANGIICKTLKELYGFDYNEEYCDINNYKTTRYKNWFLGSYGKKVGTFFSSNGADDIDLIIPDFDTHLSQEKVYKNDSSEGSFSDVLLDIERIRNKDYYKENPYCVYIGGSYRLQRISNPKELNKEKKILFIADSYGQVVIPFLALNASDIHAVDIRDNANYIGEKVNVFEYIEDFKPDYVIVLYQGVDAVSSGIGRFDFDLTERETGNE